MIISEKIQAYRKKTGLSQEELAKSLLVSRQTISLWENGQTLPTIDNLIRLKEIFGVSLDEILSDECAECTNTAEEYFNESYSTESAHIGNIKRGFLYPKYVVCGLLLTLVLSLIGYDVLQNPDGLIGIVFPLLIAAALTLLTLSLISTVSAHKEITAIESNADQCKSTVRIGRDAVVIETKRDSKVINYSRSEHAKIRVSKEQQKTVALCNGTSTVYLDEGEIKNSNLFPSFKKMPLRSIQVTYITAAATLAIIAALILNLVLNTSIGRIERASGVKIPEHAGITESKNITFESGITADYYAELFFDQKNAEQLVELIKEGDGWTTISSSSHEFLAVVDQSAYSGAEYVYINEYKDTEAISMFYFEDENMLRVIIFSI